MLFAQTADGSLLVLCWFSVGSLLVLCWFFGGSLTVLSLFSVNISVKAFSGNCPVFPPETSKKVQTASFVLIWFSRRSVSRNVSAA